MSRWQHSICDGCWKLRHGGAAMPYRVKPFDLRDSSIQQPAHIENSPVPVLETKVRCYCGVKHSSGIFVRGDGQTGAGGLICKGECPKLRRRRKYRRIPWTAKEDAIVRQHYAHKSTAEVAAMLNRSTSSVSRRALIVMGLHKDPAYLKAELARLGATLRFTGVAHQFPKGHVPQNKGKRMPGWGPGRMRDTQFKKGNKPWTWMPIGSTRYSKEGYLQRKVSDTGYPPRDWRAVHVLLWEGTHGRVPPKHAVAFIDGDRTHIALDNLECISRAELARRNRMWNIYPREIALTIQAAGQLSRRIREREEECCGTEHKEQNAGPAQPSV